MTAALREIVVVQMADSPGGLDQLLKVIVAAGVSFVNAYGIAASGADKAFFVIDVQDIPDAGTKLAQAGLEIVADSLVYGT